MKRILRFLYDLKWHFDLGVMQISWVTGKLPELMAVVYLMEKFGYEMTMTNIATVAIVGTIILVVLGVFWRKSGLYAIDMEIKAKRDPITRELLENTRRGK